MNAEDFEAKCDECGIEGGSGMPALEHYAKCPRRLAFFGAPAEWGIGKPGEIKEDDDGQRYQYGHTWHQLDD